MEMIYRKVGRRYVPFEPFTGFPADGIWLVKKDGKSSVLTAKLDDLDGCDLRVVTELSKKYDNVMGVLMRDRNVVTRDELVREIIAVLSKHGHEQTEETW